MTLFFTNEDQAKFEAESKEVYFASQFNFLSTHRGLRKGCLHLFIGTPGSGKTVLVRTLIRDVLFKNNGKHKIGIWLSEEKIDQYRALFTLGLPSVEQLKQTEAFSEIDSSSVDEKSFFEWIEFFSPDVLFIDNLTTSKFYMDKKPNEQAAFSVKLKSITQKVNCATVIIAHTGAHFTDHSKAIMTLNDIRGSKTITNITEYGYTFQRFHVKETYIPVITISKHRTQDISNKYFILTYDRETRTFMGDKSVPFEILKGHFETRNKF